MPGAVELLQTLHQVNMVRWGRGLVSKPCKPQQAGTALPVMLACCG